MLRCGSRLKLVIAKGHGHAPSTVTGFWLSERQQASTYALLLKTFLVAGACPKPSAIPLSNQAAMTFWRSATHAWLLLC